MAKKVTIDGSNKLSQLSDDWGGKNESGSSQTKYGVSIPAGAEWGMNRGEVERFIKQQFGKKAGAFRWQQDGTFYKLQVFATEADKAAYIADPENNAALLLAEQQLPISSVQSDSYVARLYCNRDNVAQYVAKDGSPFIVGLRFSATHIIAATSEQEGMNGSGTLIIERDTSGNGNFTQVGTRSIVSVEPGTTGYPVEVDLGPYLAEGRVNVIRMRASFRYSDNNGEQAVMTSSNVIVNVTSATLNVRMTQDWTRPIMASGGSFPLSFSVTGAVQKWLHVTIQGSEGVYSYVESIGASVEYPETSPRQWTAGDSASLGILTHGVHEVRAWVTCDDGSGHLGTDGYPDSISSDVVVHRLMVVNTNAASEELIKPRLLLQNVKSSIVNYVRTVIADYAVWIPDANDPTRASNERIDVSFRVTDSAENDTDYTTVYAQEEHVGENGLLSGTAYQLDTVIEIEAPSSGAQVDEYLSYLRVFRYDGNELENILFNSQRQRFITLAVDNRENFAPTSGAWFVLNPRNRNNSDSNRNCIINAANGEVVPSEGWDSFGFVSDAWTTAEDGQKVLRVLANEQLTIDIDPWEQFNGSDVNSINSQMTLEIDYAVRNITQEDESVIDITQEVNGETLGMRLLPLEGFIMSSERQAVNDQDFGWEEGKRTHLTLTIHPSVVTRGTGELPWMQTLNNAASQPLHLAKVYINGYPERDMDYVLKAESWGAGAGKKIVIGCRHADIDIYGIRCLNAAISSAQDTQDYSSSLPTAEEKLRVKRRNDITTGGRIDYEKAKEKGYRCLTWIGQDQYKVNQDKDTGYAGYWRIDNDSPAFSGTIGKASYLAYMAGTIGDKKCLMITAQGSTANTYWENNGQTKCDKVTYVVNIPFSKLHADFGWKASKSTGENCENPMYLNGERIEGTDYAGLSDAQKALVTIDVIDGWFDGNGWSESVQEMGMYHGQFYTCYEGGPKCSKLVNKINYASPMQSHKMGATRLYNDVMKAVLVGGMQLHKDNPDVRFAVYEESFLYFTENPSNEYRTEFHGMCTFGFGKFDKQVFGVKQDSRTFGFEGLNNNLPLCDFRVPADEDVTYSPDDEAWCYNGVKSMEYGLGKTETRLDGNGNVILNSKGKAAEFPKAANDAIFRKYVNFIYSHCTQLRYYNGTKAQFVAMYNDLVNATLGNPDAAEQVADMQKYQYWMTNGLTQLRFDYVRNEWTDAGTWNQSNEINGRGAMTYAAGERKLDEYYMTAAAYENWRNSADYGSWSALNEVFRRAYALHFADYFGTIGHVKSHLTQYNLVNFLLAGTDNCSKNLYYQYDPETGLIFLDGDDLDSILPNDNNGRQTKKYFLDRMHDVEDYMNGHKPQIDYEGRASILFNTIECAYEENSEALRSNMREVLTAMASLVSAGDGYDQSVMGCMEKYFFSIQEYFPQVAYQEQARIRYEFPKSFGYISFGNQARGIDPITQQVGSQLFRERQYMRRRLAYIASYACWGDFSGGINTGVVGLDDSGSALSLTPGSGNIGGVYQFDVTPHQWIYPIGFADRAVADPHVRVAPGDTCRIVVAQSGQISGDSSVGLAALNYYRKIGNLGNMVVGNNTLSVVANRLTEFIAEPSDPTNSKFRPGTIALSTPNLRKLSLNGVRTMSGAKDFSALRRCEEIDLRGTNITIAEIPLSQTLTALRLPASITRLTLLGQPSLETLEIQGYANLAQFVVTGSPLLGETSRIHVMSMKSAGAAIAVLRLNDIDWLTNKVESDVIRWLLSVGDNGTCELAGSIELVSGQTGILNYDDVAKLITRYGNIRLTENPLYVGFSGTPISTENISIDGKKYVNTDSTSTGYDLDANDDFKDLSLLVSGGNDVAVATNAAGRQVPDVVWELVGSSASSYAEFQDQYSPVLHFKQKGSAVRNIILTVRVTLTNTSGETRATEKVIGLWNRIPEVGDYAWTDGQFDNTNDTSKQLAGVVVRKTEVEVDGKTVYDLDILSADNTSFPTSDVQDGGGYESSWGIYPQTTQADGLTDAKTDVSYDDEVLEAVRQAVQNWAKPSDIDYGSSTTFKTDVFDTPLINMTDTAYLRKNAAAVTAYGSGVAMQDASNVANNGYAVYTQSHLNNFQTKEENAVLLSYADAVLRATLQVLSISQSDYAELRAQGHCTSDGIPLTTKGLHDIADMIVERVASEYGVTKPSRYRQLLFMAARRCNVWSPAELSNSALDESKLHESYRRGKWMLPSSGLLARIFNFMANSRPSYSENGAPSASYANENVALEAQLPLFANAMARGREIPISSGSYHWSSTEYNRNLARLVYFNLGTAGNYYKYNSYVVRPVTAFRFVP
ncbi:MAG: hypothetical protein IJR86_08285 [Bacteroidaceae bacterium]|nr:hypothetical protein [Bacteroidaceae bacterium]